MRRVHLGLGILICIIVPVVSRLTGSGTFAFEMFTSSEPYRLEILAQDDSGRAWWISPTDVGVRAGGAAQAFLTGAEEFRHGPAAHSLRTHLPAIGRFVCGFSAASRLT